MTIGVRSRCVCLPRGLIACLLLLCCVRPAAAQEATAKHVLLHRIAGGDSVVYILGSVHVAKSGLYPLGASIERAFAESDRLAVEVDARTVDQETVTGIIAERGMLPPGRTLRGELGEESAERLGAKLTGLQMPPESLDPFKPWVAYTMLSAIDLLLLGYDSANGVDLDFLGRAGDREIIELESVEFQLDLLAGFSEEEQLALLVDYLEDSDGMEGWLATLFDAWLSGDAVGMEALVDAGFGATAIGRRVEEVLLRRRDAAMAERIEGLLALPGTSFVVIGAAHTIGRGSVIDLLIRRGFAVTTVSD